MLFRIYDDFKQQFSNSIQWLFQKGKGYCGPYANYVYLLIRVKATPSELSKQIVRMMLVLAKHQWGGGA